MLNEKNEKMKKKCDYFVVTRIDKISKNKRVHDLSTIEVLKFIIFL